ncbi:MAG: hypothetical protein IAF58_04450 [Leptolyngbya sp.]|nr:hypothetical protein [Candidatus Melainabacteria bacterium]
MEDDNGLVPHFVPMLGQMMAIVEKAKGRRLSSVEINETRDSAIVVMVPKEVAGELRKESKIRDLNADNIEFEWQTRRIEFTESAYPVFLLYVPVRKDFETVGRRLFDLEDLEYEFLPRNQSLFESVMLMGSALIPAINNDELEDLNSHTHHFLVYSKFFVNSEARSVSKKFLGMIEKLLDAGALGVSVENSYCFHSKTVWKALVNMCRTNEAEALINAFVRQNLTDDDQAFSLGMQFLGLPDCSMKNVIVDSITAEDSNFSASDLFRTFSLYLADECPSGTFRPGNSFSTSENSPRFKVYLEHTTVVKEGDMRYNPFGTWRFEIA